MAEMERPDHWPLPEDYWQRIDQALALCDDADELYRRMRAIGMPAEAAEEACRASRAELTAMRQTFFPHHP